MPELPEVEAYRRVAERALGRRVAAVVAPDAWYLKGGLDAGAAAAAIAGRTFTAARRIGKLLLLDTDGGPTLGLRFGMTGRLVVDGVDGVGELIYSSRRDDPAWDRFSLRFDDGGVLRMQDPRRLGGVSLDPDEARLGVDLLAARPRDLRDALAGSTAPLKARLLDQARIAGVGNLIADEALWRAGLDPRRRCVDLDRAELTKLSRALRTTVADLIARGGSHTGRLHPHRHPGGCCPRGGCALATAEVGGRTTWWCPTHQR